MLDDLVQAIETLKQRIREHGPYVGAYESRTRVSLIDPMLSALGWDVANPALVQIEPRTTNGWADYALLGSNGRPVIFVEAKKLADRDSHVQQAVGYAVSENMGGANVPYCACTNGDNWEVFDVFSQKPVLKVSISTEDAAKCALQFLGLWRRSLSDGSFAPAVEPVVGSGGAVKRRAAAGYSPFSQLCNAAQILWCRQSGRLHRSLIGRRSPRSSKPMVILPLLTCGFPTVR